MIVSQIPFPITTCLTCRESSDCILHGGDDTLLTQDQFALGDKFVNIFFSVFFMLSMQHKFWLFGAADNDYLPAREWVNI